MRIITIVTLLYLPATFVSVSDSYSMTRLHLMVFIDLFQHGYREISKRRTFWGWRFFKSCLDSLATGYTAIDGIDGIWRMDYIQNLRAKQKAE
jgi:hypothetical protein